MKELDVRQPISLAALCAERAVLLDIRRHPGWSGQFTRREADGASYSNGERVRKTNSEPGDFAPDGAYGSVLGSIRLPDQGYVYFIEWDREKRVAALCPESKLDMGL